MLTGNRAKDIALVRGLQDEVTKFFIFALILFLTSLCSVSICLLVSSSVELLAVANLTVSVPFVLMLLFSGFLIRIGDLPVWLRWLQYLSVFRYGLAGLQLNELEDMTFTGCIVLNSTSCISGNQYLSQQSLHYPWDIWQSAIALAGISVVLLLFTYVQLRRRRKIT